MARYNGIGGMPAYIAVNGVVYDVSNNPTWRSGNHFGATAGRDVTAELNNCHMNNIGIINTLPRVGVLITPALQMSTDDYSNQVENPAQPDLRNLRKAAAREITGAVYRYFKASRETWMSRLQIG